jgi:hypothetical protein
MGVGGGAEGADSGRLEVSLVEGFEGSGEC